MQVGVSLASWHRGADGREAVRRMIERARVARDAGLDSLTVGDQHAAGDVYVQNVPILARLTAEWDTRRATGCLFLLPLWHPVLVAEQVGTLAALVEGPFVVQTGVGTGSRQFAALAADLGTRGRVTDEAIRVIRALFAGDTVDSELLGIDGAVVRPVPAGPVEWWIGGNSTPARRRAARLGDVWYAGPDLVVDEAARLLDEYGEMCADAGRPARAVIRRDVIVLDDADRARRLGDELVAAGYRGMGREPLVYGGVDEAVEAFAALGEAGFEQIVVRCMYVDQAEACETLANCGEARRRLA